MKLTEDEKFSLIVKRWIRLNLDQPTKLKVIRALIKDWEWAGMMEQARKPFENLQMGLDDYRN